MFNRLMPKEEDFYGLLEQATTFVIEGAKQLNQLMEDYTNVQSKLEELESLEHACDKITHTVIDRLNETFITPFDREDIHELIINVDDVLDTTEAAAQRMLMYRIKAPTPEAKKMGQIVLNQAMHLHKAMNCLRDMRNFNQIMDHCVEIHRLENESDLMMKQAIGRLFDTEQNALEIMRMKEMYENLEIISDKCEDVANVIQGIAVKMH